MTAKGIFEFYLDSFIELYRHKRDLLRFNQFFNIYIQAEHIDPEAMKPYRDMIEGLRISFHVVYARAEQDHTVRTDESEEEMFSTTLHLMLAAATRYAIGLVYIPEEGFDAEKELEKLKAGVSVTVFSDNLGNWLHASDEADFRTQFPGIPLQFITVGGITHDRYIILDYDEPGGKNFPVRVVLQGYGHSEDQYHCGNELRRRKEAAARSGGSDETESGAQFEIKLRERT